MTNLMLVLNELDKQVTSAIEQLEEDALVASDLQAVLAVPEYGQPLRSDTDNATLALESLIEKISRLQDVLTPPLHKLVDGIFAFTTSAALRTAVELGIADILAPAHRLPILATVATVEPTLLNNCGSDSIDVGIDKIAGAHHDCDTWVSTSELARRAGADPDALAPLLHLLVGGPGIFAYSTAVDGWRNNAASTLLRHDHWTRWHSWASLYTTQFYGIAANIAGATAASTDTRPEHRPTAMHLTYGAPATDSLYELLSSLPWVQEFHATLGVGATAMAPGMMADYPWHELGAHAHGTTTVCDLAGGNGEFLATLLHANSQLRGALLELEATAAVARRNLLGDDGEDGVGGDKSYKTPAARGKPFDGLAPGQVVEVHAGDFFDAVPAYPVYTIRWTLHNWDDVAAVKILRNVACAIQDCPAPENRLLIIESVVVPGSRLSVPALYGGVIMSAGNRGGKERTEAEWKSLAEASGWRVERIYRLRHCIPCVIDLRRK